MVTSIASAQQINQAAIRLYETDIPCWLSVDDPAVRSAISSGVVLSISRNIEGTNWVTINTTFHMLAAMVVA